MNKKKIKTILNILGYIIVLISFVFIYQSFKTIDFSVLKDRMNINWIINIAVFSIIYSILFQLQGVTWNFIVQIIGEKRISFFEILSIYSTANIAKYIPGNILVFVERHLILRKSGISDVRLVLINLSEIACFFGMSVFISLIGVFCGVVKIPEYFFKIVNIYFLIILSIIAFIVLLIFIIIYNKKIIKEFIKILNLNNIIKIIINLFLYFLYFVLYGLLNALIFKFFLNIDISFNDMIVIISIFSISWVAGYIVLGSSGGIGIRESILMILLSSYFIKSDIFIFAVISRIITSFGEIFAFIYARIYKIYIKFKNNKNINNEMNG